MLSILKKIHGLKEIFFFDNFIQITINQIFFPAQSILLYRKKQYSILIDKRKGDVNGIRNVITSSMYNSLLRHCQLKSPITLMDLGANAGGFPLLLLIKGFSISHYVGVEMSPFTFSRLYYNIHSNLKQTDVQLIQKAVYPIAQEIIVPLSEGSTGDSILSAPPLDGKISGINIKTITFDEAAAHFGEHLIDLCKIDIESAEYALFESEETSRLLERVKNIIIEIHSIAGKSRSELIRLIEQRGFDLKTQNDDVYLFQRKNL